ncbi:uncharacterized protein LOC135492665 [Lineus longissimus]|uniref:uncharacterized protein LOC135492665 n=1 Tax=Lineus longissimus TaxID=88925 RepID=UPI002B4E26DA
MFEPTDKIYVPVPDVKFKDLYDWSILPGENGVDCSTSDKALNGLVNCGRTTAVKSGKLVRINDTDVALFRFGETVFGINERCPHAGGPLHVGDIEVLPDKSVCVRCPWHSWKFDIMTGKSRIPLGHNLQAETYDVLVKENGDLKIAFEKLGPSCFSEDF